MLEKQDIQTIAEIFHSSMNPIKEELQNVKGEVCLIPHLIDT